MLKILFEAVKNAASAAEVSEKESHCHFLTISQELYAARRVDGIRADLDATAIAYGPKHEYISATGAWKWSSFVEEEEKQYLRKKIRAFVAVVNGDKVRFSQSFNRSSSEDLQQKMDCPGNQDVIFLESKEITTIGNQTVTKRVLCKVDIERCYFQPDYFEQVMKSRVSNAFLHEMAQRMTRMRQLVMEYDKKERGKKEAERIKGLQNKKVRA